MNSILVWNIEIENYLNPPALFEKIIIVKHASILFRARPSGGRFLLELVKKKYIKIMKKKQ